MNRRLFASWIMRAVALTPFAGLGRRLLATSSVEPVTAFGGVLIYDLYAMALYFDGSLGPKTGEILAKDIIAAEEKGYLFWHGHGGVLHQFKIRPEDFEKIRSQQKVTLETDLVANHSHKFFIDPMQTKYRIPGREPIEYIQPDAP